MSADRENAVTVIVCNYNYGRFVGTCLDSVAAQSHMPWNLIVVDDASTDDSRAVIEAFLAAKGALFGEHAFLVNDTNAGKLACLNRAMAHLDTPLALILDSDDYFPPGSIARLLEGLLAAREENPAVGFVYSDSHLVDEAGVTIGRGRSSDWSFELLQTHSYIPECALTVSRALHDAAPFDESIRVATKHHKWMRIAEAGWEGRFIPEPLFHYRMHRNNLSGIGKSVLSEEGGDARKDRLLSGYWPTAAREPQTTS